MPFEQALHGNLASSAGSGDDARTLSLVHVAGLAANVGFVNFDVSANLFKGFILHGEPKPMQHEPCGLLSDTQVARNFVAAHPVLAVDEHPKRRQPLVEADRAILEDAADFKGELFLAVSALPERAGAQAIAEVWTSTAPWAPDAIRPSKRGDEHDAGFDIGEVGDCAEQGVGSAVFGNHAPRIAQLSW